VAWPSFEFWDPLLSPVSMKLQTSNFAAGLRVTDTKQKVLKWAKRGVANVT